jgi:hypothetical protein
MTEEAPKPSSPVVDALLHLIYPVDVSPQEFDTICENALHLAEFEHPRGTDYADVFEIHTRFFQKGLHYNEIAFHFEGHEISPAFSCTIWKMKRTEKKFPVALECKMAMQGIELSHLVSLARMLNYHRPIGERRIAREIDRGVAELIGLLKEPNRMKDVSKGRKSEIADSWKPHSVDGNEFLQHRPYGVCIIESWNSQGHDSGSPTGGRGFVADHKFDLMGLFLKPLYDPSDLNREQEDVVLPPRGRYSFSENIFCNFNIRSGLIVYNKQKKTRKAGWPQSDEIYIQEYLDVFRILRSVWAKAAGVLFALDVDFFRTDREEDPSGIFRKIKALQEHMNWAELQYSTMGSSIYRDLYSKGLSEFGITDAINHVSKIESLVSARSSYGLARRSGITLEETENIAGQTRDALSDLRGITNKMRESMDQVGAATVELNTYSKSIARDSRLMLYATCALLVATTLLIVFTLLHH